MRSVGIHLLVLAALALGAGPAAGAEAPRAGKARAQSEAQRLQALIDADWEWQLREFPTRATALGDKRYNDRWTDLSPEAIARRKAYLRERLARIQAIRRAALPPEQQLDYDLFLLDARLDVEGLRFPDEYLPLHQMGGVYSDIAQLAQWVPRRTVRDYEAFLARLRAAPALVDQTVALLREGLAKGVVQPRAPVRSVEELIRNQLVEDPTRHPVYRAAFAEIPDSIPEGERARLQAEGARAIREAVVPAYQRLLRFWVEDYFPKTRESVGLSALPDGAAWYAYNVKRFTTTDLTPEQIHQLGLSEVQRIRAEMERVMRSTGFKGTLSEFFHFLRTDPQFFFKDAQALLAAYRDIAKRIDPELPRLFGRLPRLTYGVLPVPAFSEKTQTTAYYQLGSPEAGRPGYFYANTYDLSARPRWEMEALTVHEAVPGHHLQIALAQELEGVPAFRRHGGFTAFVEGWGLYAESLGPELGLYKDPYSRFGQLTYEMWRAIRLVVDTGMHAKGWTREQAIDFFKAHSSKPEHDITVEIDRYIVWPGQALAYKVGELKLKELRTYATRELGERFDLRRFHDAVLLAGPLPLDLLEQRVRAWVAQEKRKTRA